MLTIHDNPVCEDPYDFEHMVLAFLKSLKFLDYRLIDQKKLNQARDKFNEAVLKLNDEEEKQEQEEQKKREKEKEEAELAKANLAGINDLFEKMMEEDSEFKNIESFFSHIKDCYEKYQQKFKTAIAEFKEVMFENHKRKNDELEDFQNTILSSTEEADKKSKKLIEDFEKEKKRIFMQIKLDPMGSGAIELLTKLRNDLKKTCATLTEIEVDQSEAFVEIIRDFETNFKELDSGEDIQNFFKKLKKAENSYFKSVNKRLHKLVTGQDEEGTTNVEIQDTIEDKENIDSALKRSTENHQDFLSAKEEELLANDKRRIVDTIQMVKENEHYRNRSRILEIVEFMKNVESEISAEEAEFLEQPEM